jgi:riboflavin synthase
MSIGHLTYIRKFIVMFTGIIQALGQIESDSTKHSSIVVKSPLFSARRPALGASIAIDGVCLTVSQINNQDLWDVRFDLGSETKKLTLLDQKKPNSLVNIELGLKAGEPLDGHFVQGHIDGLAQIIGLKEHDGCLIIDFAFDDELCPLIVKKGSIAVNGVSLTVNSVENNIFSVCLIPHTLKSTCFSQNKVGDKVHIETDIIGRYLIKTNFSHKENSR